MIPGRYLAETGRKYFEWQNRGGINRGVINARKFSRYLDPRDTVLDFGCGGGHLLSQIRCRKKIGIEVNPAARAEAEQYGYEIHDGLDAVVPASVDAVIMNHSLEHLADPLETLRKVRRVLGDGGKLICCVPMEDWRTQKRYRKNDVNCHLYAWTPQSLGNLLKEAGFGIGEIKIYTHAWPPGVFFLNRVLPLAVFDWICRIYAICKKRRQMIAVAVK
ncbi:MAG TPA: class I SAM-dependent methyltransferase [Candidatus Omnitrophota bacterium]|nr:class I SAM-dependent methyltransferase [Candidatus Omnitrophota bacterium]